MSFPEILKEEIILTGIEGKTVNRAWVGSQKIIHCRLVGGRRMLGQHDRSLLREAGINAMIWVLPESRETG